MRNLVIAAIVVRASSALADGGIPFEIEAGKTIERNVGYATGWFCDDPSLVRADLVTRNDANVWIVTGVKIGTTQCRVGTDLARVHYVFDVTVIAAKPKR